MTRPSGGGNRVAMTTFIVDDDVYVRTALEMLVSRDPRTRVWGAVSNVDDAVSSLHGLPDRRLPEVVLLDVRLGGDPLAGIGAIPRIREVAPSSRILMVSVDVTTSVVVSALAAGADGYVWKDDSAERITEAILRVGEGRSVLSPSVASALVDRSIDVGAMAIERLPSDSRLQTLSDSLRKTVYLYCVCGLSAREIASELSVTVNTVQSRIKVAYQVLGASGRHEAYQRLVGAAEEGSLG